MSEVMMKAMAAGFEVGSSILKDIEARIAKAIEEGDEVSEAEHAYLQYLKDMRAEAIAMARRVGTDLAKKLLDANPPELQTPLFENSDLLGMPRGSTVEAWMRMGLRTLEGH